MGLVITKGWSLDRDQVGCCAGFDYNQLSSVLFTPSGAHGVNKAPPSRPVLGKPPEFIPGLPCFLYLCLNCSTTITTTKSHHTLNRLPSLGEEGGGAKCDGLCVVHFLYSGHVVFITPPLPPTATSIINTNNNSNNCL